jgi:hypothetical protein
MQKLEDTHRDRIRELAAQGKSTRAIVKQINDEMMAHDPPLLGLKVSQSTVSRALRVSQKRRTVSF